MNGISRRDTLATTCRSRVLSMALPVRLECAIGLLKLKIATRKKMCHGQPCCCGAEFTSSRAANGKAARGTKKALLKQRRSNKVWKEGTHRFNRLPHLL